MYGAFVIMWIILPVFLTGIGSMTTDIIGETCVSWGVYSSYAVEKGMIFSGLLVTYLLPLMMMLYCYSRIVYALKHKVTTILG